MKNIKLWDWAVWNQRLKSKNKLSTNVIKTRRRFIVGSVEKILKILNQKCLEQKIIY